MSERLVDTFLSEANELVADIEKSLLELDTETDKRESIGAIFRAMHTLKGAAGMFGFELVKNITHHLENIYQSIRDGKSVIDSRTIEITFKTLDQLRLLLSGTPSHEPEGYAELLQTIRQVDAEYSGSSSAVSLVNREIPESTYYVRFTPSRDILKNGTNPLFLVDDLLALGHGFSLPSFCGLSSLDDLEIESCYMVFEVALVTSKPEEEIKTVFLFAEGDCEVEIKKVSSENLLKDFTCENHPFVNRDPHQLVGFDAICKALEKKNARRAADVANKVLKSRGGNIRVSSERLDELMNLVSELVTTQARLTMFSSQNQSSELASITENIEKITRRLRDNTFTMTLVPLEHLAVRFQRLVNDLSKELGKAVDFRTEGLDTKIDKSIIEKLTDPILHILRNSIDHGLEHAEERERNGKTPLGTITLKSYYSGSSVVIEISDDGAGIHLGKVRNKAVANGLISAEAELSDKELVDLIFLPGFSTASAITGVSGRGVGMDVVRNNVQDMRGEIEVISVAGKGTSFIIRLPLTLSILDGLLVKIGNTDFILPLSAVVKCYEVPTRQLETTFNKWVTLEGKRVPFIYLREEFSCSHDTPEFSQLISVPFNGTYVGLAVDRIIGEYQAVLKPLGQSFKDQDEFSGATILGDGTVALVLDTNRVIKKLTTS